MRLVAWPALLSSSFAPVVLIVGWTTGAIIEGRRYNPVTETISVLAAGGRTGYWVLTGTLIAEGVCHLVTAWGLRAAKRAGRLCLAGGGVAAILLSLFPAPRTGGSLPHGWVVGVGFSLLAVWPVLAVDRRLDRDRMRSTPWGLRLKPSVTASVVMWGLALWFVIQLEFVHAAIGVAERVVTSVQSVWPLVVVASCLRVRRSGREGQLP
ncbi:DUF998 domain-containing protein [Streptomyces sp. NBC_01190]|uniref:DUF998 domain-containing protein n=1 Tax=Streptomyces sp. NBC_01190 TaxID=2903767 RepID=UPI00386AC92F|nr:DUF998 domain-containing protein [Streptomyces sp. NBC_01190]